MDMIIVFAKQLKINRGGEKFIPLIAKSKPLGQAREPNSKQVEVATTLVLSNAEEPPVGHGSPTYMLKPHT